jgi:hypothetical protein
MLPAAGAVLIVLGVGVSWWHVDGQLSRAGAGRGRTSAGRTDQSRPSSTVAAKRAAPVGAPAPTAETPPASSPAATGTRIERRTAPGDDRIFASSWLDMDRLSRPKGIADDTVVADGDEPESLLPGAVGGDLGDPIRPIPRPRPIVISPIVTAPIVDAPPVSTLATPVSTLSGDNSSRDQTGPGKSGGVRP